MRTLVITLAIAFISFGAFAQKRSDLTGPAYKNYKPWLNKSAPTLVYSTSKKVKLTGPAYKNYKSWRDTSKKEYVQIASDSKRSKLTGPAYKNYKPWKKEDNQI